MKTSPMHPYKHRDVAKTAEDRFWQDVTRGDGCWEWTGYKTKAGYGQFERDHRQWYAHRYSYALHNGPIIPGMCVLHHCDNPGCVNPAHLFVGTMGDNMTDKTLKGRARGGSRPGELHHMTKLTDEDVFEIRELCAEGHSKVSVARCYDITATTVGDIVSGRTWKHLLGVAPVYV